MHKAAHLIGNKLVFFSFKLMKKRGHEFGKEKNGYVGGLGAQGLVGCWGRDGKNELII